jgi:transposase
VSHANALLTPRGRLLLARCVVEERWTLRRAAERFQVSVTTAARWAGRYREHGAAGMADRSSRPYRSPRRTPTRVERRILKVRVTRRWGPARIGFLLGLHPSTVHRVLSRYGMARLTWLDRPTGRVIRRYEHAAPGDLVHIDVKKLGRIPDGGGWRIHGRAARPGRKRGQGYSYLHTAIDDHSRLAYSELLTDERQETAAAFGPAPTSTSPAAVSPSAGYSPTTAAATGPGSSPPRWATSRTSAPAPTGRPPTARSNASTGRCSRSGPTPTHT